MVLPVGVIAMLSMTLRFFPLKIVMQLCIRVIDMYCRYGE